MLAQKVWHIPWKSTLFKINEYFFHPGDIEAGNFYLRVLASSFCCQYRSGLLFSKLKRQVSSRQNIQRIREKLGSFNLIIFLLILYCNGLTRGASWSSANMNSLILSGFLWQLQKIRPSAYSITRLAICRTCYRNALLCKFISAFCGIFLHILS
jgi:hypothetical protein